MSLPKRLWPLLLLVLWAIPATDASACPFCNLQGQTLLGEVKQSSMVLFGRLTNANETANTTDLVVEAIIKDNAIRGKKTTVTVNKYIPLTRQDADSYRWLIFCDVYKKKIDPYRGVAFKKKTKVAEYLRGAIKVMEKPASERLRFFFDYLENDDLEICNDAFREFGNSDYTDVKAMTAKLFAEKHPAGKSPAERLAAWIQDKETPALRIGLFASLLGHSGKTEYTKVYKKLLEDEDRKATTGVDALMAGYVLLKPKEGWAFVQKALKNTKEDFMFRYRALLAVRFLYQYRSDVVAKKDLVEAVCVLLEQDDIADMAIEDLRKWKAWDKIDTVLGLQKKAVYKQNLVKRAILRYCLQCPTKTKAAPYVAARRKADAEAVADAEELLKLEEGSDDKTKEKPKK